MNTPIPASQPLRALNPPTFSAFFNGLETALDSERQLLLAIRATSAEVAGYDAAKVVRMLQDQETEVTEIHAMLERTFSTVPLPADVSVTSAPALQQHHPKREWVTTTRMDQVHSMIEAHDDLLRQLEFLAQSCGSFGVDANESLGEAARRHDRMSWTLWTLLNQENEQLEDVATPLQLTMEDRAAMSETEWENEGGSTIPRRVSVDSKVHSGAP